LQQPTYRDVALRQGSFTMLRTAVVLLESIPGILKHGTLVLAQRRIADDPHVDVGQPRQ
jgi:hypothetical protein